VQSGGHGATTLSAAEASAAGAGRAARLASLRTLLRTRRPLRRRLAGLTKYDMAQDGRTISITNQGPRATFRATLGPIR